VDNEMCLLDSGIGRSAPNKGNLGEDSGTGKSFGQGRGVL